MKIKNRMQIERLYIKIRNKNGKIIADIDINCERKKREPHFIMKWFINFDTMKIQIMKSTYTLLRKEC